MEKSPWRENRAIRSVRAHALTIVSYQLLLIHNDENEWADEVERAVRSHSDATWLDQDKVERVADLPQGGAHEVVALYLATEAARDDPVLVGMLESVIGRGVVVVPVVRESDRFDRVVPELLSPINALTWEASGADVSHYVLAALGLAESERQLFISYRRSDAALIAEALWHRLSERRFDVFLDRFSVPPGVDFQRQLQRELADKAFVVVIESPAAAASPWVEYEVSYALTHQIGVMALTLPTVPPGGGFGAVAEPFRIRLDQDQDLEGRGDGTALSQSGLDRIVRAIELAHEQVLIRRRAQLIGATRVEFRLAGWEVRELPDWSLLVNRPSMTEVVRITPRAPTPLDLMRVDRARRDLVGAGILQPGARARVVHNTLDVDPSLVDLVEWIGSDHELIATPLPALPYGIGGTGT
jgi:hypothetical protein